MELQLPIFDREHAVLKAATCLSVGPSNWQSSYLVTKSEFLDIGVIQILRSVSRIDESNQVAKKGCAVSKHQVSRRQCNQTWIIHNRWFKLETFWMRFGNTIVKPSIHDMDSMWYYDFWKYGCRNCTMTHIRWFKFIFNFMIKILLLPKNQAFLAACYATL